KHIDIGSSSRHHNRNPEQLPQHHCCQAVRIYVVCVNQIEATLFYSFKYLTYTPREHGNSVYRHRDLRHQNKPRMVELEFSNLLASWNSRVVRPTAVNIQSRKEGYRRDDRYLCQFLEVLDAFQNKASQKWLHGIRKER